MSRHPLRLVQARLLSPAVRQLTFEAVKELPDYRAGQSMNLLVPTRRGLVMRRPYSVASAPGHAGPKRLDFAVTRVEGGPTSTALHELELGALVEADGPNRGWLGRRPDEAEVPTLIVATGSGLAPFRAVLQEELTRPQGPPLTLLFGCRTQADILWREELEEWANRVSRFTLRITLSRPDAAWSGRRGWVQQHLATEVAALRPRLALLCGLSPMIEAVERQLVATGLPESAVRVEAFDV